MGDENSMWIFYTLISCFIGCILINQLVTSKNHRLPPGLPWIPVVGSIPYMATAGSLIKLFEHLRNKYGDVFTIYLGSRPTVVVNGYAAIKQCLVERGSRTNSRPYFVLGSDFFGGKGILGQSGPGWKAQRMFTSQYFRTVVNQSGDFENQVKTEIGHMVKYIKDLCGTRSDPWIYLSGVAVNIQATMYMDQRWNYDDPVFRRFLEGVDVAATLTAASTVISSFPIVRHIPGNLFGYKTLMTLADEQRQFVRKFVKEHRNSLDPNNPRDFLDAYLVRITQDDDPASHFTEEDLIETIRDLISGGYAPTSVLLFWMMYYLVLNPAVQDTMAEEIQKAESLKPDLSYTDRDLLPYTMACLQEILRCGASAYLALPHMTNDYVTIKDYVIPPGITIVPNLHTIKNDDSLWPEPELFKPERHLKDGKFTSRMEIQTFSFGPRRCGGEIIARMEVFWILVGLVRAFRIKPDPSAMPGSTEDVIEGQLIQPKPYKVSCHQRV